MQQYLNLLQHIIDEGTPKTDRTGTGTKSCFGYQLRFDLSKGFPLVTTKKLHLKSIIYELLWFLKGDTNIQYLKENKIHTNFETKSMPNLYNKKIFQNIANISFSTIVLQNLKKPLH